MDLYVWNSRGDKWNTFWTNVLGPALVMPNDVGGLLVESGWPPWMRAGNVRSTNLYELDEDTANPGGAFTTGILANRRRSAWWCPWGKKIAKDGSSNVKTNSRCSFGVAVARRTLAVAVTKHRLEGSQRPAVRILVSLDRLPKFVILLVHLKSSQWGSRQEAARLMRGVPNLVPQGVSGLIVGDINCDLFQHDPRPDDDHWRLVNTGAATQMSGGELDYGLLYSGDGTFKVGANVALVQPFQTGWNQSDHSVLQYTLGLR